MVSERCDERGNGIADGGTAVRGIEFEKSTSEWASATITKDAVRRTQSSETTVTMNAAAPKGRPHGGSVTYP